jgi:DNA-binding transcriptional LysR family regulator
MMAPRDAIERPGRNSVKPRQLEVLYAIMSSASLTDAARALGTSQPAVSATLKQMEEEMALRLFHRLGGRLVATPEAELLFPEVERLFRHLQAVRRMTKGIREGVFDFLSVIATPTLADTIVPGAFLRLRERRPSIRLRLETAAARVVADSVARREFDLGVIYGPNPHAGTGTELLGQTFVSCAMHKDHPLAKRREITARDLAGESIVTFPKGAPIRDRVDNVCRDAGVELTTTAEVTYSRTACVLAQGGGSIAIIDPLIASTSAFPELVIRRLSPAVPIELLLLSPASRPSSRLIDEMRTDLRAVCGGLLRMCSRADRSENRSEI